MTPQKALEILEMFLHKQCDLQRTKFAYSDIEVYKAVSMANYALKKQLQETTKQDKALTFVFGKDGKAKILNEDYVIYCADKESFEKVKEAVEKQIPKKPIRANRIIQKDGSLFLNDDNEYRKCSICTKYDVPLLKNQDYCHCCGQALDWSDTE